jgi:hypothetical protein
MFVKKNKKKTKKTECKARCGGTHLEHWHLRAEAASSGRVLA